MIIKEQFKPSLTRDVRKQIRLNQERGDTRSYDGGKWSTYGEHFSAYDKSFNGVLERSIHALLRKKKSLKIIDFMGPSEAITTLFERFPKKPMFGVAVSLSDLRSDGERKRDARLNVKQTSGDILKSSTWDQIEEQLQGYKADLIMERAHAGFWCIPVSLRLYAILLNRAWGLLSEENGVLIAEVPTLFQSEAKRIIDSFRKNNEMDASTGKSLYDGGLYIKMVKTPNSPKKLPFPA